MQVSSQGVICPEFDEILFAKTLDFIEQIRCFPTLL
jgi:hypothetical protein